MRNSKGITIIALVITIIVLLILAGVSITIVFGEHGIIKSAQEASNKTNEALENDKNDMKDLANKVNELRGEGNSGIEEVSRLYLIKDGKDCTEVTGGWEGVPYYGRETGNLTFEDKGNLYANFVGTNADTMYWKATKNEIDWSEYQTINMVAMAYHPLSSHAKSGGMYPSLISDKSGITAVKDPIISDLVDISKIKVLNQKVTVTSRLPQEYTPNYFAGIMVHRCSAYIYDVYLEK